jgi:hypothetical protein
MPTDFDQTGLQTSNGRWECWLIEVLASSRLRERFYADALNCIADLCELGLVGPANQMLRALVDARSTAAWFGRSSP